MRPSSGGRPAPSEETHGNLSTACSHPVERPQGSRKTERQTTLSPRALSPHRKGTPEMEKAPVMGPKKRTTNRLLPIHFSCSGKSEDTVKIRTVNGMLHE